MNSPKTIIFITSIIGALAGIFYTTSINPLNNYFVFMALFAMVGVGIANLVLMAIYRIYEWTKQ